MKKFIIFCLITLIVGIATQIKAQQIPALITIAPSDTTLMSTDASTRTFTKTLTNLYLYNWAVSLYYFHWSATADSCRCALQESLDGTNFSTIRDKTSYGKLYNAEPYTGRLFTGSTIVATDYHIWTNGEGPLPNVWVANTLRVRCTHYLTGSSRVTVKLQLKLRK